MAATLSYTESIVVEHCCACGISFGIPKNLQAQLRQNHEWFYCPMGHQQHYVGKTEEEKLRERLVSEENARVRVQAQLDQERASHSATKGQLTKAKKQVHRAERGVCPVKGCKRSFVDVERHVRTKHPEVVHA